MPETTAWFVYIIRTNQDTLYTGITTDLKRRFAEHQAQGIKTAKYLRGKAPLQLVYWQKTSDHNSAAKLEAKIKKLSKLAKEKIISDFAVR